MVLFQRIRRFMRKTSVVLDRKETEGAVWRIWFLTLGFEVLSEMFGRKWVELGVLWSRRVLKITEQRESFPLECVWSPVELYQ